MNTLSPRSEPVIALVAAVAKNGVIGADGGLPWRLPTDLKHFKAVTMGGPVIMGRKTWDSIGKALPGRRNIVVTRSPDARFEGADTAHSLEQAIAIAGEGDGSAPKEIFILGGGALFAESLPLADRLYLTHVKAQVEGDTFFPEIDATLWRVADSTTPERGEKDSADMDFVTYERRRGDA